MKSTIRPLLLLVLSIALAACAPAVPLDQAARAIQSHLPGSTASGGAATGPAESAVQLTILRGDLEQEQAIARRDSSLMRDTSTDSYYQQVAGQNQDLLDHGVTAVKLVNVEWGRVDINGSRASAINYETWSTTYADGTSDQSRDRNVYTLVQENGVWKIASDEQPDSGSTVTQTQPSTGPNGQPARPGPASARPAPSSAPAASPSAPPGSSLSITAAAGTPEAAIQEVILKGNREQEQAIATKDSSVMRDTSTDSYYRDLAQTNQDMLNSGVVGIKLLSLDWGPVTVNGSTATATTYETWWTEYSDGSTEQSGRERNDYTLVQDNGVWKVQADDHPEQDLTTVPGAPAPGNPVPTVSPAPPTSPAPRPARGRGVSRNWSGYAANGGKFTAVTGTWTVPQPTPSGSLGADAAWVGIGGENSRDLIQAGTEQTVLSSGRVQYDAWIEMLPQYSHPIPLAIHPGDSVTVTIAQQADGRWKISFKNNTTSATYDRTVEYNSSLSSAEWIEEAPSGGRGGVLPLDNFGSVTFSNASAVKDGQTVNLQQAGARPITMVNAEEQPIVTPSAISDDGAGFTLTRTNNPAAGTSRGSRGLPRSRGN